MHLCPDSRASVRRVSSCCALSSSRRRFTSIACFQSSSVMPSITYWNLLSSNRNILATDSPILSMQFKMFAPIRVKWAKIPWQRNHVNNITGKLIKFPGKFKIKWTFLRTVATDMLRARWIWCVYTYNDWNVWRCVQNEGMYTYDVWSFILGYNV